MAVTLRICLLMCDRFLSVYRIFGCMGNRRRILRASVTKERVGFFKEAKVLHGT
jgi:hypothetical protein